MEKNIKIPFELLEEIETLLRIVSVYATDASQEGMPPHSLELWGKIAERSERAWKSLSEIV